MIPRAERRESPEAAEAVLPGATKEIEVTHYIFSFGPGDILDYEVGPNDSFEIVDDTYFYLVFADGEQVVIDRYKVRFWSRSSRKITVPAQSV